MYSIVPFTAGAIIAVGILSAFAPMSVISVDESPVIAKAQAATTNDGVNPAPSAASVPGDIKGGGSSDGSTGPNRPNANLADGSDANRTVQDKRLQQQQRDRAAPMRDVPAGK